MQRDWLSEQLTRLDSSKISVASTSKLDPLPEHSEVTGDWLIGSLLRSGTSDYRRNVKEDIISVARPDPDESYLAGLPQIVSHAEETLPQKSVPSVEEISHAEGTSHVSRMVESLSQKHVSRMEEISHVEGTSQKHVSRMEEIPHVEGKPSQKPEDVVEAFIRLSKEEGFDINDDIAYVVNIGNLSDKSLYYTLALAMPDFVHFQLRQGLGAKKIDALTWRVTIDALRAVGIRPSGKCKGILDDTGFDAKIKVEQATKAVEDLMALKNELPAKYGRRLTKAMEALGIGEDTTEISNDNETLIDDFKRFTSISEDGKSLSEHYEQEALEKYGVAPGSECGYVILSSKRRDKHETVEAFRERHRTYALSLTKKLRDQLGSFPQLVRLSLHPCSFGEVVPIGFVPEEREVVTIDEKGVAKKILGLSTKIPTEKK